METTDTGAPLSVLVATAGGAERNRRQGRHRLSSVCRRVGWQKHAQGSNAWPLSRATSAVECSLEVGRERRLRLDRLARDRVREREARGMQELALEVEVAARRRRGRPTTGRSIAARWTRIWCVRPVSSRTRSSACSGRSSTTSKCVTASRGRVRVERLAGRLGAVAADRAPRSGRCRERGRPRTSARYSRSSRWRRTSDCSRRYASSVRATTISPDVSRSSRWTIPGPLGASPPAVRPRSAVHERPGRVARAGMDDDARGLVHDQQVLVLVRDRGGRALPRRARAAAGGSSSTCWPASRRYDLARAVPSTSTPPASRSRSAAAREPTCSSPARNRSSRSPAASSATRTRIRDAPPRCPPAGGGSRRRAAATRAARRRRSRSTRRRG